MSNPTSPVGQPPPSNQIGDYLVDSILGEGAAAMVYRAHLREDTSVDVRNDHPATVALKVLKPAATKQPNMLACFQFEARVLSRLNHPGILRVYNAGVDNDRMYTAMELVDGESFDKVLLARKRLGEAEAHAVARQLAESLDYLHSHGYVHRDIKPANLMLTKEGRFILFDFGTVIRSDDGAPYEEGLYGTPSFLAPEQTTSGGRVDGRADLYALGIMLYLMVAGRKPFYGSRDEVLAAHRNAEPPLPSDSARVTPELEAVILKSLAKDPDDRYQTGAEFAQALAEIDLTAPPPKSFGSRILGLFRSGV